MCVALRIRNESAVAIHLLAGVCVGERRTAAFN